MRKTEAEWLRLCAVASGLTLTVVWSEREYGWVIAPWMVVVPAKVVVDAQWPAPAMVVGAYLSMFERNAAFVNARFARVD